MSGWFWGFVARSAQVLVEAAPTLLCGVLVAGVLRRMAGPEGTRRLFGASGWTGLLRAWVLGMLLPVCALGVLPVVRELRRAGVSGGNILAFALVGPLLNPISFLYGLTLGEPTVILAFAGCSLVLSMTAGLVWEKLFPSAAEGKAEEAEPQPAPGAGRMLAVGKAPTRQQLAPCLGWYLVAACVSGLVSASLPAGSLQHTMGRSDPLSPSLMALLGTGVYMGPLPGMMRIGLMFEHGNSIGAAFVLLVLGIGVNLGVVLWAASAFGWRPALSWFGLVTVLSLGMGHLMEGPLATNVSAADHTHAFDDFTNPFHGPASGVEAWALLGQKTGMLEGAGLLLLGLLLVPALVERLIGYGPRLDAWLASGPKERPASKWDVAIPDGVLAVLALAALVAFGVMSAYVYYPPPEEVREEMGRVRVEAVLAVKLGQRKEGIRRLEQWDLLTRKLQVGWLMRHGTAGEEAAKAADDLREAMEEVRDALLAEDDTKAIAGLDAVEEAFQRVKRTFAAR